MPDVQRVVFERLGLLEDVDLLIELETIWTKHIFEQRRARLNG